MSKRQFKAESKKLLDLMINSIYTNREIFLRELVSNASDALDKIYYESLTNKKIKVDKKKLFVKLSIDKEKRLLTIEDNGNYYLKDNEWISFDYVNHILDHLDISFYFHVPNENEKN